MQTYNRDVNLKTQTNKMSNLLRKKKFVNLFLFLADLIVFGSLIFWLLVMISSLQLIDDKNIHH